MSGATEEGVCSTQTRGVNRLKTGGMVRRTGDGSISCRTSEDGAMLDQAMTIET